MKKQRKIHYFLKCPGFSYSARCDVLYTQDVKEITCGQCKGRILEAIRALDWSKLGASLEVLTLHAPSRDE